MKRILSLLIVAAFYLNALAISPYLLIGNLSGDLDAVELSIEEALWGSGFEIIGSYFPASNEDYLVLVYSSQELQQICSQIEDRGMLAAALKIGIRKHKGKLQVTMLNPEYLFYAYIREQMENTSIKDGLMNISSQAIKAMKAVGTELTPFGGDLKASDLMDYKYMLGMPKFDDPVELHSFGSFNEAVSTIESNLSRDVGRTLLVYELIDDEKEIAVFGIGLLDQDKGEAHFLPIIGQKHIAAMPYEIIVEGGKVTMLHGRFRFASHWPELTMGTFTKIMSSPGDVEDTMRLLTE